MKKAFTLAEVLITLAIIGVVAALTIPSVVANTQQQEFKTGLRKAVSVLNSAITMNMAIDGETPYENGDLYHYLQRHMSVMRSDVTAPLAADATNSNVSFYTTDGMRFDFPSTGIYNNAKIPLYENNKIYLRGTWSTFGGYTDTNQHFTWYNTECGKNASGFNVCSHCGSYGLASNTDNTTNSPCFIMVDVNGDRKPFPKNASCWSWNGCNTTNVRKYGDPSGTKLTDVFSIMITDKQAIPYGVAAQKAMYEAQK